MVSDKVHEFTNSIVVANEFKNASVGLVCFPLSPHVCMSMHMHMSLHIYQYVDIYKHI